MFSIAKIGLASLIMAFSSAAPGPLPDPNIFSGVLIPQARAAEPYASMTDDEIKFLIKKFAEPLHVNQKSMYLTVKCESPKNDDGTYNPLRQSEVINEDGTREDSWGVSQISRQYHPEITKAQAQDAPFSIEFMAKGFASGNASQWSCWRILKQYGKI